MAFVRVEVKGARELEAKLAGLDTFVATKLGQSALRRTANEAKKRLREAAPYDPTFRIKTWITKDGSVGSNYYGHLRDNFKVRKATSKNKNFIVYNITTGRAFWGYFQEFGTRKMPARPWARPAVEMMKDDLVRVQIDLLGKGIEAYARRSARINPTGRNE